jgi:histidine triad (HIT) family protein
VSSPKRAGESSVRTAPIRGEVGQFGTYIGARARQRQTGFLQGDRRTRDAEQMSNNTPPAACFVCAKHALGEDAPGGVLFEDELVYAGHAYPLTGPAVAYRGYLVAEPKRHAAGLGDLTDPEAAALGQLVNRLARALKVAAGAEHVYSFVFGDGVAHLHIVLAPRYPGTPREYWGVRLRDWPDSPRVDEDEMRSLVANLRSHIRDR